MTWLLIVVGIQAALILIVTVAGLSATLDKYLTALAARFGDTYVPSGEYLTPQRRT